MNRCKLTYTSLAFMLALAPSAAIAQSASEATPTPTVTLFSNKVKMPAGGSVTAMKVELKDWPVSKALNGLQIPTQGFYVAQLLSGAVITDIQGNSVTRKPGGFWAAEAGSPMMVTLGPRKESTLLRTITLSPVP